MRTSPKLKKCHLWGNTCFPANFPFSVFFLQIQQDLLLKSSQTGTASKIVERKTKVLTFQSKISRHRWDEVKSQRVQRGCRRGSKNILTSSPHLVRAKIREWRCQLVHKEETQSGIFRSGARISPTSGNGTVVAWSQPGKPKKQLSDTNLHHKGVILMIANLSLYGDLNEMI